MLCVTCVYNNLIILHNLAVNLLCHICIDCEIHCLDFRQLFASQGAAESQTNKQSSHRWTDKQVRIGEEKKRNEERGKRREEVRLPYVSFGLIIWQTYLYKS